LNIWCYTGYTYQELLAKTKTDKVIEQLLKHIDVLVDGKFTFKLISTKLKYRGSTNQKLIDVPKSLKLNREVRYELK
jgi:anaerobic ribonucleoside-triphosphate reductase activating protein